jgi:hypothetical protein
MIRKFMLGVVILTAMVALASPARAGRASAAAAIVTLSDGYDVSPSTLPFIACDPVNGSTITMTGRDILVFWNTDQSNNHTITVNSVAIGHRLGDLTKLIGPNTHWVTQQFPLTGWMQSDGKLYLTADDASVKVAIIRLP